MFNKENKKCHGVLAWAIVILLALIFIVLVFKVGMMVGGKGHYSSGKAGNYHKNFGGYIEKCSSWKKSEYEAYEAKAKAMGMTLDEYKAYLAEQKKQKTE